MVNVLVLVFSSAQCRAFVIFFSGCPELQLQHPVPSKFPRSLRKKAARVDERIVYEQFVFWKNVGTHCYRTTSNNRTVALRRQQRGGVSLKLDNHLGILQSLPSVCYHAAAFLPPRDLQKCARAATDWRKKIFRLPFSLKFFLKPLLPPDRM